jgi:DNA-binding CsgD family transcriptional regulator
MPLSPRQSEIVALLEDGAAYENISEHLGISQSTVRAQLNRIRAKFALGPCSLDELVRRVREIQAEEAR